MEKDKYIDSIHRVGRWGSIGALIFMLGIPLLISAIYDLPITAANVLKGSSGLLAIFIPLAFSEVLSYLPILGSSSYLAFITGNLLNLKIPCVINAMTLAGAEQGTKEGDVISLLSIAVSSMTTMLIIALGVVLLVPLAPLFKNESVKIATNYILPALFGGMFVPMLLNKKAGEYEVKGKLLPCILPLIAIFIINLFIKKLFGYEGIALLFVIPTLIISAKILYDKGIIKLIEK